MTMPPGPPDPWANQRVEMPQHEFDGVDYFVNTRPPEEPEPAPTLGVYLDLELTQPELAERLPGLLADMQAFLDITGAPEVKPAEVSYALVGAAPRGLAWRGRRTEDRLADLLRGGQVEGFDISFDSPSADPDRYWFLWLSSGLPMLEGAPLELSLTASASLWPAAVTDPTAERLLDLLSSWLTPLSVLNGAVTYDRVQPPQTPWEQWYSADRTLTALLADRYVRGYHWANLLTAGHLERLGGTAALEGAAAGAGLFLQRLAARRPTVLLRDSGPVTRFDDTRLAAMKTLLTPVLPELRYRGYLGWPLRIIRDPGTAFRRLPPGAPGPRLLPDPRPPLQPPGRHD